MFKSIVSFVMAFVIAAVSIAGLDLGRTRVQAAEASEVTQAMEPKEGKTFLERVGILGFLWDDDDKVFYSAHEAWQRNFGYNRFYDFAAQFLLLYYDTCRVKFTYGGRDWLIQFWKGQYGLILIGAEVGVYSKPENSPTGQYDCADDSNLFSLGYTLYSHDKVLFVRSYQETWWLTGFKIGKIDKFSDRSQLSMRIRITLKDDGMREAFVKALCKWGVGFKEGDAQEKDTFYVLGNDVYIMWNTDRNKTS